VHRQDVTLARAKVVGFKVDEKWQQHFGMITRGFVEEFGFALSRNAWVLYLALATFYNIQQQRAFPNLEMLYAVCPLSKSSRSRALGELFEHGLVEVWSERLGRRRRTFYRLPHVDAKGHHLAEVQQPRWEDLLRQELEHTLPEQFAWVHSATLKSGPRVSV
jgi:DNA-binding transcriptional ArsR family regulator